MWLRSGFRRVLAALAVLIAATPALAPVVKDELVIGITQYPSTLHPLIDAMVAKSYVLSMVHRPLTAYDKDWKRVCMLCTELPTLENGRARLEPLPDGRNGIAVTYTIQPAAAWGDGTPVTTDDVLFAWEVGRHPKTGVAVAESFTRISKIDVVDKKTFTLHANRVHYEYNALEDFGVLPAHLDRKIFEDDPESYARRSIYQTDPTNPGLYDGPYRIAQVVPGAQVVLEPNPVWYGTKPYFKRVTVRTIENTSALEANLLSGNVDYIPGELGLTVDQALNFEKRHRDRFRVIYKPQLAYEHIDLNVANPILKDKRVRQALLYALDRETMCRQLFEGKQPVAHSFVSPLDWMYDADLPRYAYDPTRAAALLDAAGWKPGSGGIRINAAGERLQLEIVTTAGNRVRETIEQVLQSQWRKVGLDVRIRNEPARVFVGETLRKRRYAMGLVAWVTSPENSPRSILHSSEIPTEANGYAGQNDTGFSNPEADAIIDRLEVELDTEKRRILWRELQALYLEELPVLPLFFHAGAYVMPPWLTGLEPTGHQYGTTYWVENWRAQ
jgi:peptide/nickel transport system substrate-binding protein